MSEPFVSLPGVICPCGSAELQVIVPGSDGDHAGLFGWLRRPVADRGWCSIACARVDGWPWLKSEQMVEKRMSESKAGFRLHGKSFDRGTGKHSYTTQDFSTKAEADLAKTLRRHADPDGAYQVSSIVQKPKAERREKIGPGHPGWQGHRRLTA